MMILVRNRMSNFHLDANIASCQNIIKDITLLAENNAPALDFLSLATLYEYKFKQLTSCCKQYADSNLNLTLPPDDFTKGPDWPSTTVSNTSTSVISTKFLDADDTEFEVSFGMYDNEWILGIDSSQCESISICTQTVEPLIDALRRISSTTANKIPPNADLEYAQNIAKRIWTNKYQINGEGFEPENTLHGVLNQLNNLTK